MRPAPGLLHALTIDVEDYFQVSAFEPFVPRDSWPSYEARVVANTGRVLELLARHNTHATFFVLGWVAEHYPQAVREILSAGHEIGSHGYWHRLIYQQQPAEFRADLQQAGRILSELTGRPVTAYRAPSFSIIQESLWALEILVEEGFLTDSSIFPVYHDRYGIPGAKREFHPLQTPSGTIWECPPSVRSLGPLNLPVAGGGYFRLFPHWWTQRCIQHLERQARPCVLYLHPWEFDPEQPRLRIDSRLARFRHYVNLTTTQPKLDRLLQTFRFGRLDDVLQMRRTALTAGAAAALPAAPQ